MECICDLSDKKILLMIQEQTLPSDALVNSHCWSRICQVRGRNFNRVNAETWSEICARRGYLRARQNPRGF